MIHHIGNLAFKICLHSFYIIPLNVLYILSKPTAFALQYLFRYRKSIIENNIDLAFSDTLETSTKPIVTGYYHHLSEILVESIKLFSSKKVGGLKFEIANPEIFEDLYEAGQSAITLTGHIGNWELNLLYTKSYVKHKVVAVYKTQSNTAFNELLKKSRNKSGITLIDEESFVKILTEGSKEPTIYLLMADQRPRHNARITQIPFLSQSTYFSQTIERLAYKFNLPVVYADITKLGRGEYRAKMIWVWRKIGDKIPGLITKRYAHLLERNILAYPTIWLWSHDRWKTSRKT